MNLMNILLAMYANNDLVNKINWNEGIRDIVHMLVGLAGSHILEIPIIRPNRSDFVL